MRGASCTLDTTSRLRVRSGSSSAIDTRSKMPRLESRLWLSSKRSKEKGSPGAGPSRARPQWAASGRARRARRGRRSCGGRARPPGPPGLVLRLRERHVGPDPGVEVAGPAPGVDERVAAARDVSQAVGEPGPQGELPRALCRPRTAAASAPRPRRRPPSPGARAGRRRRRVGCPLPPRRRTRRAPRSARAPRGGTREHGAVLLERRVHQRPARLRAQALEEQRIRISQLHRGGDRARARA